MTVLQHGDIEYNRVYRRAEFAERPSKWSSPLPSIEIIGKGEVMIYGSNLPRYVDCNLYQPPILDTKEDIQANMLQVTGCPITCGFHDACMQTVWIAFCWIEGSSDTPPIIRDASLLDWELDWRRKNQGC